MTAWDWLPFTYTIQRSLHNNIWLRKYQSESSIPLSRVINTFYCLKPKPPPWTSCLIYFYEGAWWPSLRNSHLAGRWIISIPISRICTRGIISAHPHPDNNNTRMVTCQKCVSVCVNSTHEPTGLPTHACTYTVQHTHTYIHRTVLNVSFGFKANVLSSLRCEGV